MRNFTNDFVFLQNVRFAFFRFVYTHPFIGMVNPLFPRYVFFTLIVIKVKKTLVQIETTTASNSISYPI